MSRSSAYYGDSAGGLRRGQAMLDALNAQYDDIISWADMYDSASMESKKMIVSCLIRRVEVYRDYRLHIDFNIDFEQFSAGWTFRQSPHKKSPLQKRSGHKTKNLLFSQQAFIKNTQRTRLVEISGIEPLTS